MGVEHEYWIIPKEDGLHSKDQLDFEEFLEKAGYNTKNRYIYFNGYKLAHFDMGSNEIHVGSDVMISNNKEIGYILDFILLLKVNKIRYKERFNRDQLVNNLEERIESSKNLINRLNLN